MRINASGQSQVLNIYSNNQNSAKINMNTVSPVFKNRDVLTISKQGKTESLVQQLLNQKKLIQEKTDCHVPEWRREEELRAEQDSKVRQEDIGEQESGFEQGIWSGKELKKEDESQEVGKSKANEKNIQEEPTERKLGIIEKVEDLFTDE